MGKFFMIKEVNTFHSGRYLFSSDITIDMSVLNEAVNVLSLMPLFPEIIAEYNNELIEKSYLQRGFFRKYPCNPSAGETDYPARQK